MGVHSHCVHAQTVVNVPAGFEMQLRRNFLRSRDSLRVDDVLVPPIQRCGWFHGCCQVFSCSYAVQTEHFVPHCMDGIIKSRAV